MSDTLKPLWRIALGFDFGMRRIGVAVGSSVTGNASPLRVIRYDQQRWNNIAALITEWQPEGLVVGIPRHADASANIMTAAALRFSRQLHGRFQLPVATIDERLSSWEASQHFAVLRPRPAQSHVDAEAAAVILQSWLRQTV